MIVTEVGKYNYLQSVAFYFLEMEFGALEIF